MLEIELFDHLNVCNDGSDGEAQIDLMVYLWGMRSTPSLPSLQGQLCHGMVASDMILSMGEIELNCVRMLNWIVWNKTDLTSLFVNKNYTLTKLNGLKFNSAFNDPKRIDTPQNKTLNQLTKGNARRRDSSKIRQRKMRRSNLMIPVKNFSRQIRKTGTQCIKHIKQQMVSHFNS